MKFTLLSLMFTATSAFMVVPTNNMMRPSSMQLAALEEPSKEDEAPFFIAGEYDDDGYGDEGGEYYEEDEMPTTTSTMMKNPFANTNFKAPQIDTSKVKTWLTDFANSPEGEQALDNLKNFAGMVGSMGKDLAMNVGSAVGESLKELKEKKKSSAGTGGSGSSIAEKYDSYTPPTTPKSTIGGPSFSYLEALSDDEVTEEDEDEFYP